MSEKSNWLTYPLGLLLLGILVLTLFGCKKENALGDSMRAYLVKQSISWEQVVGNPGVASFRLGTSNVYNDRFLKNIATKSSFSWNKIDFVWNQTEYRVNYQGHSYSVIIGNSSSNYEMMVFRNGL